MSLSSLATEEFVQLTTFRRNGDGVPTPVWVAAAGDDALVVTTMSGTGKVKRLRRDPRVTLVPCSRMGTVPPGATPVPAAAEIVDDPTRYAPLTAALRAKYGLPYRLISLADRVVPRRRRGHRVYLVLRPAS